MVQKVVKSFDVNYVQIIDKDGRVDQSLYPADISDEELKRMYEMMIFVRNTDQKLFNLQRQGRVGTYIQVAGQEAAQVGAALAMEDGDLLFPSFRETGMLIARKHPIHQLLQYWNGDERGLMNNEGPKNFPISIPVGTHIPHAAGAGWAFKLQNQPYAAVACFGDGATSKGDFHEGLNFAGVNNAPAIFFCQNNQWAISVPREKQTHAETIAQRGMAYGIEGLQVDGNDLLAVYVVMKKALEKAKSGHGPTLIEALTYRIGDHSTSDDAKKYRDQEKVEEMKAYDPVVRFEKFLESRGLWTKEYKDKLEAHIKEVVEKEVEKFEALDNPPVEDMFKAVYEEMTPQLKEQLHDIYGK